MMKNVNIGLSCQDCDWASHCRLLILENPKHKDTMTFYSIGLNTRKLSKTLNEFPDRVRLNFKTNRWLPKHTESMVVVIDLKLHIAEHERYMIEDAPSSLLRKSQVSIEDDEVEFSISKVFVSYSVLNYLIAHADLILCGWAWRLRDRVVEQLENVDNRWQVFLKSEDE